MTTAGDVIRQVTTILNDTQYPPTVEQRVMLTAILCQVIPESAESRREPVL